jgi:hypothetical protein
MPPSQKIASWLRRSRSLNLVIVYTREFYPRTIGDKSPMKCQARWKAVEGFTAQMSRYEGQARG